MKMTREQLLARWNGPKSRCACGHLGDGRESAHNGDIGHGACLIPGCNCMKFTWDGFTKQFQRALNETADVEE